MIQRSSFTFLAAGDLHVGGAEPERLKVLFDGAARHPEAAFLAVPGDLTNDALPEQFQELSALIAGLPFPFLGTMGNHDVHTGPDDAARARFRAAVGVESASYVRQYGTGSFVFLSTDGNIDGCTVDVRASLPLFEGALREAAGATIVFCHAPLTGTVGGAPGRTCFLSDDPRFGLVSSDRVREIVRGAGKPVIWICGHTHSPLNADRLIYTEQLGRALLHSVNLSCPYYTGRDFVQTEPITLYVCTLTGEAIDVVIEDALTGDVIRRERLGLR